MRHSVYSVGVIMHTVQTTDFPSEVMQSCKQNMFMNISSARYDMGFLFKKHWLQRPVNVCPTNSCCTTGF